MSTSLPDLQLAGHAVAVARHDRERDDHAVLEELHGWTAVLAGVLAGVITRDSRSAHVVLTRCARGS